jgi:hypothetical protein
VCHQLIPHCFHHSWLHLDIVLNFTAFSSSRCALARNCFLKNIKPKNDLPDHPRFNSWCIWSNAVDSVSMNDPFQSAADDAIRYGTLWKVQSDFRSKAQMKEVRKLLDSFDLEDNDSWYEIIGDESPDNVFSVQKVPCKDEVYGFRICDDVLIGAGVIILKGVTVGEGSVIDAGAVIHQDVMPYSVAVGALPRRTWPRFDLEALAEHKSKLYGQLAG